MLVGVPPEWAQKEVNPAMEEQIAPFKKFSFAGLWASFFKKNNEMRIKNPLYLRSIWDNPQKKMRT